MWFPVQAQFDRNLSLGSVGPDVIELQKILNQDSATRVASSGPGSPGNETSYFGSLTHTAVIRFQNLYRDEVLAPVGLYSGTGYVGNSTREKLNSLENEVDSVELLSTKDFYITTPSSYVLNPGEKISISGSGFDSNTTVLFDGKEQDITESKETKISFFIPKRTSFGRHDVVVKKKKESKETFVIVKNNLLPEPKISNISPSKSAYGDKVVIEGSGFTNENRVYLGFAEVKGVVSSDRKTLSFEMPAFDGEGKSGDSEVELPIKIYVYNPGGLSNGFDAKLIYKYEY